MSSIDILLWSGNSDKVLQQNGTHKSIVPSLSGLIKLSTNYSVNVVQHTGLGVECHTQAQIMTARDCKS